MSIVFVMAMCVSASAAFVGRFAVANWVQSTSGDGVIDLSDAPNSIRLTSANNGGGLQDQVFRISGAVAFFEETTVTFDWTFNTLDVDGPSFDPLLVDIDVIVNGNEIPLSNSAGPRSQSGSESFVVPAEGSFAFIMRSTDSELGAATSVISNFKGTPNTVLYRDADASASRAILDGPCFCIENDDTFAFGGCVGTGRARVGFVVPYSWIRVDDHFEESAAPVRCGVQVRLLVDGKVVAHTESRPTSNSSYAEVGKAKLQIQANIARGTLQCITVESRDMPSCDVYKSTLSSTDSSAWQPLPFDTVLCGRNKKRSVASDSSSSSGITASADSIRESPRFVCARRDIIRAQILDSSSD